MFVNYSGFVIQDGSDIPSVRMSWDVSIGNCSLGVNRGTKNVFNIVMTIIVNMGDYIITKAFLKRKRQGVNPVFSG